MTSDSLNSDPVTANSGGSPRVGVRDGEHPLCSLPEEDLNLVTELVLASGSLKALASAYRVSYPTIRGRLDQTIARLRDAVQGRQIDPVTALLGKLVEQGELSVRNARAIQDVMARSQGVSPVQGGSEAVKGA